MNSLQGLPLRILALGIVFFAAIAAFAQTESVLYRFKSGTDGDSPYSGLTYRNGKFYGTTGIGGAYGHGAVFELAPPTLTGSAWTETILYSFTGLNDGSNPGGGVVFDQSGNLYGTTANGGANATETLAGVVFELSPPAISGGAWTETVLHAFPGSSGDGGTPLGDLAFDRAGNLYGVAAGGGGNNCFTGGCGIVYQLQPPASSGGAWTEKVAYNFLTSGSNDGWAPNTGVLVAPNGVLYGTTNYGGQPGYGVVFKLSPPATSGGAWTEKVLYQFTGAPDGGFPNALTFGKQGTLYGTTYSGGASNQGAVFRLTPPTTNSGWAESVIYSFTGGADGAAPWSPVVFDQNGDAYGTAEMGGLQNCSPWSGCGTFYKLSPPTSGGSWTETTLHDFSGGRDGSLPSRGRLAFVKGAFFGTTLHGGTAASTGFGTVFSIRP